MGSSSSAELQALIEGYTGNSASYQNPNNINLNKPTTSKYDIHFDIPDDRLFEIDSYFNNKMDGTNVVSKSFPYGVYHGQMKDGKRDGKGRFIWTSGGSRGHMYEGDWKKDMMHGKGLYIFSEKKRYNGDWYNGDMHGKGVMKYSDGYYEGDWVHDKREGKGKFLWMEDPWFGDIYEGGWKNDNRHGKGIYKKVNGDIYEGEWKNGEEIGKWKFLEKGEPNHLFQKVNNLTSEIKKIYNDYKNNSNSNSYSNSYSNSNNNENQESEKKRKGGEFRDNYGNNFGRMEDDGEIKDQYGCNTGYIRNGEVQDQYGSNKGYIRDNGEICDQYGSNIGYVKDNGEVCDQYGCNIGYIRDNGDVCDQYGCSIGNVGSMDKKAAAAKFFFSK